MGMVFGEVTFDERGPTVEVLAAKITELCGLPVNVQLPGPGDLDIHDQHAFLSFNISQEEQLEVFSYRPGAAKKFYNDFMEGFERLPTAKYAVGLNEPPGTQVVYLRSYLGHEPTLMMVTVVALEALGGRPREPLTEDDRREYGVRIAAAELQRRREKLYGQLKRAMWLQLLLLPITIPMFLLSIILMLALMPWRLWQGWKVVQKFESEREHIEFMNALGEHLKIFAVKPEDFPRLDRQMLTDYSAAFEALGFVRAVDFEVKLDVPNPGGRGFARLYFHPTLHCVVEVNQIYPDYQEMSPMRCMIASMLTDGWDLATTDRNLPPLSYAWRRPRTLWESYPDLTVAELLAAHLERRQQLIDRLGISVKTDLNEETYFAYQREVHLARRAVLQAMSMDAIRADMEQFEEAPLDKWLGEFAEKEAVDVRFTR
jgi:hypothetical protein